MEALNVISEEHRNLWRLASAIELVAGSIEQEQRVDSEFFNSVFDYLEHFVDHSHHPKEDDFLFRLLRLRSEEAGPIIDRLAADHHEAPNELATLRAQLAAATNPAAISSFVAGLKSYAATQKRHILAEEKELLPLARAALTADDWREIDSAFLANDDPLFGSKARAEYRALFHRLVSLAPDSIGLGGHRPGTFSAGDGDVLLRVRGLESAYGRIKALKGIDLEVKRGEIVALVGANGAGKTTFLRTLSGVQPMSSGQIEFDGQNIAALRADQRVRRGIGHCPEGRQVFGPLSIEDNLRLGAYTRPKDQVAADLAKIYAMFPVLQEKHKLPAGTLSGGQQQMLAIGRALMGRPKLLLLDEPSMGLAPLLVEEVFNIVKALKAQGITILLVEQNAFAALAIADRGYVMETGAVTLTGTGRQLLANDDVRVAYLGM
ncbi:MAG: ATP-binding cassette domain-containing protein [Rhodopseudomonas sp.]|nr:ATP-binding cassette domain-containing protein [Rhodopseudomonas sp.]